MPLYTNPNARVPVNVDLRPVSFSKALGESFFLGADTAASKLYDFASRAAPYLQFIETGRWSAPKNTISAEDANAQGEQYGLKYHFSVTPEMLAYDIQREQEAQAREALIQRGPDGAAASSAYWAARFLGEQIDPVNIASWFIPVGKGLRAAGYLAEKGAATAAGRIGEAALEGAVGNLVAEPLNWAMLSTQHKDYTTADTLSSVVFGSIFGAGIRGSWEAAAPLLRGLSRAKPREGGTPGFDSARGKQPEAPIAPTGNSAKLATATPHEQVVSLNSHVAMLEQDMRPVGGGIVLDVIPERKAIGAQKALTADASAQADWRSRVHGISLESDPVSVADKAFPLAKNTTDGLVVRSDVPNESSIDGVSNEIEVLNGIREIPIDEVRDTSKPYKTDYYSKSDIDRVKRLAEEIKQSGEISPLIVVIEGDGYMYVLEGGHRLEALHLNGAKSFPAKVVLDLESIVETGDELRTAKPSASVEEASQRVAAATSDPRARLFNDTSEMDAVVRRYEAADVPDMTNEEQILKEADALESLVMERVKGGEKTAEGANIKSTGAVPEELARANNAIANLNRFEQAHKALLNCLANGGGV